MAGPRARKVRDWYIIALVSGEVVGYLRREANGFTTPCVGGGAEGAERGVEKERRSGRRGRGWRGRWAGEGDVAREAMCQGRRCEGDVGDGGDGDSGGGEGGGDGGGVEEREAARSYDTVREEEVKGETRC
jgi:hypothetical protein